MSAHDGLNKTPNGLAPTRRYGERRDRAME
jgi:hypothetical protein